MCPRPVRLPSGMTVPFISRYYKKKHPDYYLVDQFTASPGNMCTIKL
jgi:hypothetical protein